MSAASKNGFKAFEVVTDIFLCLMISVFLLAFDSSGFSHITSIKRTLFYIICGGYLALTVLLLAEHIIIGALSLKDAWKKIRPTNTVQFAVIAYAVFTVLSAVLSKHTSTAWVGGSRAEGALTILIYCLVFYAVSKLAAPKKELIYIVGGASTLFCVLSVLQLYGLNPFNMYPAGMNYFDAYVKYSGAYLGTIGNIDFVAAFLCIVIPIFIYGVFKLKEKYKYFLILPLALCLFVLVRMQVLAGFVGVFAGLVCTLPFCFGFSKKAKIIYFSVLGGGGLLALIFLFFADIGSGMLHEIHEILHGNISEKFATGRIYIWQSVLSRVGDNLFFGKGPDTMRLAGIEPFERFDKNLGLLIKGTIDAAHCEPLNVLYHQGVFACASYITAVVSAFVRFAKNAKTDKLIAIMGGAVFCYFFQSLFGISQLVTAPFFWIALGLLSKERLS